MKQNIVNNITVLIADKGMIFKHKIDDIILSDCLYLGCNDSADNYEEVSIDILNEDNGDENETDGTET